MNGEIVIRPQNGPMLTFGDLENALTDLGYEVTWSGQVSLEVNSDAPIKVQRYGSPDGDLSSIRALVLPVGEQSEEDHA